MPGTSYTVMHGWWNQTNSNSPYKAQRTLLPAPPNVPNVPQ